MTNQPDRGPTAFGEQADSRTFPRLEVNRNDPTLNAVLSKMVASNDQGNGGGNVRTNRALRAPDMALLERISDVTTANVADAASIAQLLPDVELAIQILVSSILSPKDMVSTELNYTVEQGQFNSELSGALLNYVREYFENIYKISELMPNMLKDILFYKGAYPMLILPETSIDDAINSPSRVSMESIQEDLEPGGFTPRHVGILGMPTTGPVTEKKDAIGIESLIGPYSDYTRRQPAYNPAVSKLKDGKVEPFLTIVDNPNVLKMPMLADKLRQDRLQDILQVRHLGTGIQRENISNESLMGGPKEPSLYRRRRYKSMPIMAITPGSHLSRGSVGHPLVMTLPVESIIPVHVPSNPEDHLGYFILLDQQSNPLVKANEADYYTDLQTNMNSNKDMVSQLISTTKRNEVGFNGQNAVRQAEVEELEKIYGDLVEEELRTRLRNGVYGENVDVARPQEVYRIMLARAMAKMHTQILYVPAEMMTYMAFDYNKYGVGTSLLANSKIIGGIRAMMMFASTMAAIKNSVGRTLLNIQLDPADPDPTATVEFMIHEYAKVRQGTYPLGASNPKDIISFLQNAAVEVAVSGNTGYPETKLEIEDKVSNRAKPDGELEKTLRDRHLMSFGLTPEMVDAGSGAEFATTIVNNNLLLAKRVIVFQNQFVAGIEEFISKYIPSSGALMDGLRAIVEENIDKLSDEQKRGKEKAEEKAGKRSSNDSRRPAMESDKDAEETTVGVDAVIFEFIRAIRLKLPSPDTATLKNQMAAYDEYVEALDKALKAYLDADFLEASEMGELSEVIGPTIAAVRAHFLRQWLRNNNVLAELDDLTTFSDEEGPAINMLKTHESHVESLGKALSEYMQKLLAARKKTDASYTTAKDNAVAADPVAPADPIDETVEDVATPPEGEPTGADDLPVDTEGMIGVDDTVPEDGVEPEEPAPAADQDGSVAV